MYKRVLLKISGESLLAKDGKNIDFETLQRIIINIKKVVVAGVELAVVVGGGNFWKGKQGVGIEKTTSDYMGILATIMNGMALRDGLENEGISAKLQTSLNIENISENRNLREIEEDLENNVVTIFAGGIGNPFFTTDTAAILRAIEIKADIILIGKNSDALYTKDPRKFADAEKIEKITFDEIIKNDIAGIDPAGAYLCKTWKKDVIYFGVNEPNAIVRACLGEEMGTHITN